MRTGNGLALSPYSPRRKSESRNLLAGRHRFADFDRHDRASDDGSYLADLLHQFVELVWEQRLRAVGEGLVRSGVNFDHESIRANSDCGAGERRDFVALAGAVAGIDQNRQMAQPLHRGHNAQVERVTRVIGERADSAFAERDVVVAFAEDVLGCHQKFFESGGHAALEENRLAGASGAFQQREILHVAGADLDDVGIFFDQIERLVIDRFGDDPHPELLAHFGHDTKGFLAESLERVRRGAGLVGAAAEELGSGFLHALGHGEGLFAAFNRARSGNDGEGWSADCRIGSGKANDSVFFLHIAADELVGLGDLDDFLHARHFFERALLDFALVAGDADGGARRAGHGVRAVSELFDFFANGADLLFSGLRLHDNKHDFSSGGSWLGRSVRPYVKPSSLSGGPGAGNEELVLNRAAPTIHLLR